MAVSLTRFSWLWWGGKEKEQVSNGSSMKNSLPDWGIGLKEPDSMKYRSVRGAKMSSSTRNVKRKWRSREERRIEKEYDVVLVPSDGGVCLSESESDDSDWSIGWLEPHAPDLRNDDEENDSFAVLVPCYRQNSKALEEEEEAESSNQFLTAIRNLPNEYSSEGKNYVEQWLSSLQNF